MMSHTCGINMTHMKLPTEQKETHREGERTWGCQGEGVGGEAKGWWGLAGVNITHGGINHCTAQRIIFSVV